MSAHDANSIFYIAGSTINAIEMHVYPDCIQFISNRNLPNTNFINRAKSYTNKANRGGLKEPSSEILCLIFHYELYFTRYRHYILHNSNAALVEGLINNIDIEFPKYCNERKNS